VTGRCAPQARGARKTIKEAVNSGIYASPGGTKIVCARGDTLRLDRGIRQLIAGDAQARIAVPGDGGNDARSEMP